MKVYVGYSVAITLVITMISMPAVLAGVEESGTWTSKAYEASGSWSIVEEGGKQYVVLSSDFSTKSAPDLKLFLSPTGLGEVNGKNATSGSVLVAKLKSNKGSQKYEIPAGVDLSRYKTILIHCEKFSKLWSGAAL
ncbi:MAG: DM13 domain-containing protein [Verrucomicrobiota bacterium]